MVSANEQNEKDGGIVKLDFTSTLVVASKSAKVPSGPAGLDAYFTVFPAGTSKE